MMGLGSAGKLTILNSNLVDLSSVDFECTRSLEIYHCKSVVVTKSRFGLLSAAVFKDVERLDTERIRLPKLKSLTLCSIKGSNPLRAWSFPALRSLHLSDVVLSHDALEGLLSHGRVERLSFKKMFLPFGPESITEVKNGHYSHKRFAPAITADKNPTVSMVFDNVYSTVDIRAFLLFVKSPETLSIKIASPTFIFPPGERAGVKSFVLEGVCEEVAIPAKSFPFM